MSKTEYKPLDYALDLYERAEQDSYSDLRALTEAAARRLSTEYDGLDEDEFNDLIETIADAHAVALALLAHRRTVDSLDQIRDAF